MVLTSEPSLLLYLLSITYSKYIANSKNATKNGVNDAILPNSVFMVTN